MLHFVSSRSAAKARKPTSGKKSGCENFQLTYQGRTNTMFGPTFNLWDLNGSNGFAINGIASFDQSGWSVSSAGDVNGDGFDDLIIGAVSASPNGMSYAGQSYVLFG